jgi:hypothetical protein
VAWIRVFDGWQRGLTAFTGRSALIAGLNSI